jgi:hypothetical protein
MSRASNTNSTCPEKNEKLDLNEKKKFKAIVVQKCGKMK